MPGRAVWLDDALPSGGGYLRAGLAKLSMGKAHEATEREKTMKEYALVQVVEPKYISKKQMEELGAAGYKLEKGADGFIRVLREREHIEEKEGEQKDEL